MPKLRVSDDDKDTITITLDGRVLRTFWYGDDDQRRQSMHAAQWYREGYGDAFYPAFERADVTAARQEARDRQLRDAGLGS